MEGLEGKSSLLRPCLLGASFLQLVRAALVCSGGRESGNVNGEEEVHVIGELSPSESPLWDMPEVSLCTVFRELFF